MRKALSAIATLHLLICGCSVPFDDRAKAYVVVEPTRVQAFIDDLNKISKENGLDPEYGRADSSDGVTLHVVEAAGRGLVVWVQNVPLSSNQCPEHAGIDPGQFSINVRRSAWVPASGDRTVALSHSITAGLQKKGYKVSLAPAVPCSTAVLSAERGA